jgi:cellulose synthase/poly-beta-1,6-N-acetylglucosamine synthase-like glycosyltransferase
MKKNLTIIMPIWNEVHTFPNTFSELHKLESPDFNINFIIIDGNSTDGTKEFIESVTSTRVVKIFEKTPKGKGNAIKLAVDLIFENFFKNCDYVTIFDGDDEYLVSDLGKLLKFVDNNLVIGKRIKVGSTLRTFNGVFKVLNFYFELGHLFFLSIFNFIYKTKLEDPFSMFKIFPCNLLRVLELKSNRFDLDIEIVAKISRLKIPILEVPVYYQSRGFSMGKKINPVLDPFTWIVAIFRFSRWKPL